MSSVYQKRFYRDWFSNTNLVFFDVCVYESDLMIGACKNMSDEALASVRKYRRQLKNYIDENPIFKDSLVPIDVKENAPLIVRIMGEAAKKADVGPMAAVAGAIAEMVGKELLFQSEEVIVENGGDIFLKTKTQRKVGIYAGESPLSGKIALTIDPEETPLGICTSSGTVGHSLSFGKADAAVIISKDTSLADAAATALGNKVRMPQDIKDAIEFAQKIEGIEGILVIIGDKMGAWGNIKLTGV